MSDLHPRERGKLRIFLGYAAGVGKTYRMLQEAKRLQRDGMDVVVGYFESHNRKDTIAQIEGLEEIPRQRIAYRGLDLEEMDTAAILGRNPEVCAVDEFPHTNVPGTARAKRWEDVMVILDAGITVLTTMNIQHLESLNDRMREITGIQVRETIPDWVVKQANEIVLIDLPPRALLNRLQRGVVYSSDKAERALQNFFKEPTLAALREMALRQTAHEVDVRQDEAEEALAPQPPEAGSEERILIHVTESPATAAIIRRGRRVADYLKTDCFAVAVTTPKSLSDADRAAIERHLDFARKLHIEVRVLEGEDVAETLVDFARRNGVTQIFLAKPPRSVLSFMIRKHFVMKVVRLARDMQVTVVAERRS